VKLLLLVLSESTDIFPETAKVDLCRIFLTKNRQNRINFLMVHNHTLDHNKFNLK